MNSRIRCGGISSIIMSFADFLRPLVTGPDLALLHEFHKPPYGGGNQFLMALRKELVRQGVSVGEAPGRRTRAMMMNSFNFDATRARRFRRMFPRLRIVHRLAGPIGTYRGTDIDVDRRTQALNAELADATIFISDYSFRKYRELGLDYKCPTVIRNTVDADIFNPKDRVAPPNGMRKVRLIATAWSDNPRKGGPLLAWLDEHMPRNRYELTFVGRTKTVFKHANVIDAIPSEMLADILREQDIYIAPSQDDPCSNALLEALACGLPAAFLESGGHPELVGSAGEPFHGPDDILQALDRIASDIRGYRARIRITPMADVAERYSEVLSLHHE